MTAPGLVVIRSDLEAILLILSYEQLRLTPYDDGVGVLTVGWGHRILQNETALRTTITRERANALFLADLARHEAGVLTALTRQVSPLQLGACVSLAFNIGVRAFADSTVADRVNSGQFAGVPDAFRMWTKGTVKGKKVILGGLVDRRESEIRLWLKGTAA